ncbi:MYH6_7 [Mytilus edulis]|uniref:MYH6_7 n=1 Tax=Mytilus edulis TaxID=6550 RepID=A0A8S3TLL7_MYTED|nr:MYH6_7 [Mytilus edulis]
MMDKAGDRILNIEGWLPNLQAHLRMEPESMGLFLNKDVAQFVEIARKLQTIDLDAVQKSFESFQSRHEDGNSKEEVIKLKEAYGVLEETCKNFEKKCMQAVEDKSEYEEKFKRIKDELRIKEKEVEHLERVVADKDRELKHMAKDKESALSRLSKEMGDKLSQDNPAIADLSDPNRSTKIAEMYNSIYDNEWTDALETLQSTRLDEEHAVIALLEIMKTIYQFCSNVKKEHVEQLENHLLRPMTKREAWSEEKQSTQSSQKQIRSLLMECIKLGAKDMIPSLQKSYLSMRSKAMYAEQIPEYVQKVMELCWLMNMCNPPLVFGDVPRTGERLDKNYYKEYTKQGEIVSYVVWFPLLIQENGPVLTKGVAQPIPSETKLSRSSVKERSRKDIKMTGTDQKAKHIAHGTVKRTVRTKRVQTRGRRRNTKEKIR